LGNDEEENWGSADHDRIFALTEFKFLMECNTQQHESMIDAWCYPSLNLQGTSFNEPFLIGLVIESFQAIANLLEMIKCQSWSVSWRILMRRCLFDNIRLD